VEIRNGNGPTRNLESEILLKTISLLLMIAFRIPALRHTIGGVPPFLRGFQRRWAQVHDVRFVATHRTPDSVLEKYRHKLVRKAEEYSTEYRLKQAQLNDACRQGLKDVEELKAAYKTKIESQKKAVKIVIPSAPTSTSSSTSSASSSPASPFPRPPPPPQASTSSPSPPQDPESAKSPTPPGIKTLSSFIDVPKNLTLPPKDIEHIWRLRHASFPQSLCATIPHSTYTRIESTARRHPQFILPLPREGQGAEIHFLQWTFPTPTTTTVLFTHLAEFKLRGEYSQPHTTVTHHLDIAGPKGLVLLQGSVIDGRGVSVDEGKWLLMCLQKFYGAGNEKAERKRLLEQFSQGDNGFKVEDLLEEAEKIV